MRRRWWILLVLLAAGVAAVVGLRSRGPRPLVVDVEKIERRQIFRSYVTASGEIVASRYADIGSSVMGRLVELGVAEGERVEAGDVLARIDPVQASSEAQAMVARLEALEAELEAALARDREATQELGRVQALRAEGLIAPAELDTAEAAAGSARAQAEAASRRVGQGRAELARARDTLSKTEITAPMDGVVTRLAVREGEMVVVGVQNQPGTILMTVSDLSSINAEVKVAEADVLRLRTGQRALVTLEALPERELVGEVVEIGASALPLTGAGAAAREFRVVVRLADPDPTLRPGLTCDARILAEEVWDVLTVPLQAVVLRADAEGGEETGLFVLDQGRVRFRPVTTGIIGGLEMAVSGVDEGDRVVAGPFQVLRGLADGDPVRQRE